MKVKTLLAFVLLGWINTAAADLITYEIGTGNSALSGFLGPYVEVVVNRTDTTHATITFSSLCTSNGTTPDPLPCDAGDNVYLMGDGSTAAVNVNATAFTVGTITGSNSGTGFTPTTYSTGSGNVNGFGTFNLIIDSLDGFTNSSSSLSFTLTNTSGGAGWLSAGSVLAANSNDSVVASHIFITSYPANASNSAIVTGFAAGGTPGGPPPQEIPEPAMLSLLGIGLLGLSVIGLRRRQL